MEFHLSSTGVHQNFTNLLSLIHRPIDLVMMEISHYLNLPSPAITCHTLLSHDKDAPIDNKRRLKECGGMKVVCKHGTKPSKRNKSRKRQGGVD
jgi:hypothetical protein